MGEHFEVFSLPENESSFLLIKCFDQIRNLWSIKVDWEEKLIPQSAHRKFLFPVCTVWWTASCWATENLLPQVWHSCFFRPTIIYSRFNCHHHNFTMPKKNLQKPTCVLFEVNFKLGLVFECLDTYWTHDILIFTSSCNLFIFTHFCFYR